MRRQRTDSELVQAARQGDREAFALLIDRHQPLLMAICRRALGDRAPAEDATQEAILQAMLALDRLRRPDRFGSWLAGIGLNICHRMIRQRHLAPWSWEAMLGGRQVIEPAATDPDPSDLAERDDLARRVQAAVAALPAGQRAAVALIYLNGLTHAETAALLGIEIGTVKTRLHKGRRTLHRRLLALWKEEIMETSIEMHVRDVRRHRSAAGETQHVIVLEETGGGRQLAIWIGEFEATALAIHLEGVPVPRPLTFTLAMSLVAAAGATLREVRINRLQETVFYAEMVMEGPAGVRVVDARPSDALNLAVLAGAPIRVAPEIVEAAASHPAPTAADGAEGAAAIAAR
jgi:RNA polymerase sigma factor (sigma-70 family)